MDCPLCKREMNKVVADIWFHCAFCVGNLWYILSDNNPFYNDIILSTERDTPYWEHYGKEYSQKEFERYLKLKAFW
jgi:Ni,Fe-hydrogenase I small subunit